MQPLNVQGSTVVRVFGSATEVSSVQLSNAWGPRVRKPSDRVRDLSAKHPANAWEPTSVTVLGRVTEVIVTKFIK